ncbi:hypothetical protein RvY_09077 [Ramazzottius varieornatus]|uniref:Cation efflux protein transmembrane domain-containing protein n=1 Tax=Ramazzottius varieornatus TaxID=947166 RepID=A0A1D1VH92_RAMVA|nr:hypothetical protein RvY_09077 [Ramazzottius varieornatus]
MADQTHPTEASHTVYVVLLLVINTIYFGASLVLSHITHSLTLRMDSNYVLYIVGSLIVVLIDLKLRNTRSVKNTFGWARIEFLGNLFNATFLASLSFSALVESVQQLIHLSGHQSHTHGMHEPVKVTILGGVRLALALITFAGRYASRDSSRNFRVSYTQTAGIEICVESPANCPATVDDGGVSPHKVQRPPVIYPNVGVAVIREFIGPILIITCGVIYIFYIQTDWCYYVDPSVCILQVFVLGATLFRAAKESGLALMLTIPTQIDIHAIQKRLLQKFPQILNIHDFHLWRTSRYHTVVTCHLVCSSLLEYVGVSAEIHKFFREEGISEVAIQPELFHAHDAANPNGGGVMSPDACRCCDASPKCCSLTGANKPHELRQRTRDPLPSEMVDLETGRRPDSLSDDE